ncbi:hypothetical protein IAR55_006861 [Kwoniella newhampshirensis]|uniref:WD40 repeat-like protein n=1 Tax=Kwoniella newhampshirensis TaxID=1651941 RepID=A0AAW0YSU5_9TREE
MPPPPPSMTYATLSSPLPPPAPYILSITPSASFPHLLLRHPSPSITIVDNQTLQPIEQLQGGHTGLISAIATDREGAVWSSGKDARVVRWDERTRRAATVIKASVRKPIPVLALTVSERDHLVIGGTELVSSESHILFWDTRHPSVPAYTHSSTHSDDITHLSLLPSTNTFLSSSSSSSNGPPLPDRLLLSASTDGLVALSNMKESDEDEAVVATDNWGQSIADAGGYMHKGKMKVWARSDMDAVAIWDVGKGDEEELELQNHIEYPSDLFKFKDFKLPQLGPNTTQTAAEERQSKTHLKSDYLIDVTPSLGVSKSGAPIVSVGTNEGDMIIQHYSPTSKSYTPSSYFLTNPNPSRGHKDVIRAIHHDLTNEAIYTGSEDGVLSGWSLSSLEQRLVVGDDAVDDDDGRDPLEDDNDDNDMEDEESEIETEDEDEDEDEDMEDEGPRYGPVIGAATRGRTGSEIRREKRREKRFDPY